MLADRAPATPQPASDGTAAEGDAQAVAIDAADAIMVTSEPAAAEQNGMLDVNMHAVAAAQAEEAIAAADDEAIAVAMAYEELSD